MAAVRPVDSPMMRDRERARRLATNIVSMALGFVGITLVILAIVLVVRGGLSLLFLAIIVGLLGLLLGGAGFFFQLVPLRLDDLAEQKRDYDRRTRQK